MSESPNLTNYECMVLFKPLADIDDMEGAIKAFETLLTDTHGGQIVEQDRVGRKRLSYPIKKFNDAFMYVALAKLPPSAIADIRALCRINDNILRLSVIARDEKLLELRRQRQARMPQRTERGERGDRPDRGDRPNRGERGDRGERPERGSRQTASAS
ncbi:MAG: 30S ribosomal protein S6 [Cyanobacteria bacterium HKST-UBA05]|nr:30S ribosomal protein S6 [Cyanobacteria bacterium HKST-UBA05]